MTTTTDYTDPNPFSATEAPEFGETFYELMTEAQDAGDPEVDARMAWDAIAFAAAAFVRNSGVEELAADQLLFVATAHALYRYMAGLVIEAGNDSEVDA